MVPGVIPCGQGKGPWAPSFSLGALPIQEEVAV